MNKMVHLSLALVVVSLNAWAAPGTQFGATSDYKNPKDAKGLCTTSNKDEFYYKFGLCESLAQFLHKPCMQEVLEKMRNDIIKPDKPENAFVLLPGNVSCSSKQQGPGSGQIDPKNKVAFDNFIMQFIAATVIQESNWDTLNGLQNTAKANHDGKTGGLLSLTNRKIYDDPANACGCQTINSQSQASDRNTADKTSGDKDGFQNLNCGTYVALKQALADHTLFGGDKQKQTASTTPSPAATSSEDNKPKGAAVFFQSLQDAPLPTPAPADMLSGNPKLDNLEKKLQNFCQNSLSNSGEFQENAWSDLCGDCKPVGPGGAAR